MILLTTTSDLVQLVTGGTQAINVHASFVDLSGVTVTPGRLNTLVTTATTTTVVASPAGSTTRNVKTFICTNTGTVAESVTVQHFDGSNTVPLLAPLSLLPGNTLTWTEELGWTVLDASGRITTVATAVLTVGTTGNAWSAASVAALGVSNAVNVQYTPALSIFGNVSDSNGVPFTTNLTVQFSQDNANWNNGAAIPNVSGDFGFSYFVGSTYVRLQSSKAAVITATVAGKGL